MTSYMWPDAERTRFGGKKLFNRWLHFEFLSHGYWLLLSFNEGRRFADWVPEFVLQIGPRIYAGRKQRTGAWVWMSIWRLSTHFGIAFYPKKWGAL